MIFPLPVNIFCGATLTVVPDVSLDLHPARAERIQTSSKFEGGEYAVVALVLVMPLLSALFITLSILGGYLVGVFLLGLDGGVYLSSLESSVMFRSDVVGSLLKSWIFGMLVGLIATYRGYTCTPNAAGVSRATTSTVVTASVCILLFDYVITALWGV